MKKHEKILFDLFILKFFGFDFLDSNEYKLREERVEYITKNMIKNLPKEMKSCFPENEYAKQVGMWVEVKGGKEMIWKYTHSVNIISKKRVKDIL